MRVQQVSSVTVHSILASKAMNLKGSDDTSKCDVKIDMSDQSSDNGACAFLKWQVDPSILSEMERTFLANITVVLNLMLLGGMFFLIDRTDQAVRIIGSAIYVGAFIYALLSYFVHLLRLRVLTSPDGLVQFTPSGSACMLG
ncbi:MAG: hypothetical protein SGPRY_009310, partial [Prymnesium sp.]